MKKIFFVFITMGLISCDDVIDVVDISSESVIQLAPLNDTVLDTTNPVVLSWSKIEAAESYHLQIATPSFANATQIVVDTTLTINTYSKSFLPANYQWRIKAKNSNYETGFSSQNFIVQ